MFIDKLFNEISASALKTVCLHKNAYIWGDSQFNKHIFEVISPELFKGIFDNNDNKWGQYSSGLQIQKFFHCENVVIVSALLDPTVLILQLRELGIEEYYICCTHKSYEKYYNIEKIFFKKSANNFVFSDKQFRYLHVIPDQKFIQPLLHVLEKGFSMEEQAFLVYSFNRTNNKDLYNIWNIYLSLDKKYNSISLIDGIGNSDELSIRRRERIENVLESCQRIIFHGEWFSKTILKICQNKLSDIKKKGILIPWSGAFGKVECNKIAINTVLRHCPLVVFNNFGQRTDEMIRDCNFSNLHVFSERISYTEPIDRVEHTTNIRPKVLVSNSCYDHNKVVESLKALISLQGQIDVYCIASYGNEEYIRYVEVEGNKLFGEDFHIIKGFMPYEEYVKFLASIDVAAMAMEVGCGMTTIRILCYVGSKLYFKKNTNTAIYADARGYKWYDIDEIKHESMEEFLRNGYQDDNYKCVKFEFDLNDKISKWHKLLEMKI